MGFHIVDISGLADIFNTSTDTLKKVWRDFPHFFVETGQNLKSARFDVGDVVEYLKGRDYECLETQNQVSFGALPFLVR